MPKPLSLDLRERVWTAYQSGLSYEAVARRFGVSVSFIRQLKALKDESDCLEPRPPSNGHSRRKLSPEDEEALVAWHHDHPDWYIREYQAALAEKLQVHVGEFAVRAALKRLGLSRKKRLSSPANS